MRPLVRIHRAPGITPLVRLVLAGCAASLLAGCTDHPTSVVKRETADDSTSLAPPADSTRRAPAGLLISEARGTVAASGAPSSASVTIAYVSAKPGTLPGALSVQIRNETVDGAPTSPIAVIDGGFDPVAVAAAAGDRLVLAAAYPGGETSSFSIVVPLTSPPIVLRTNPPRGSTDVVLFIRPTVVFSEPLDPGSLVAELRRDGVPVSGDVGLVDGSAFIAEFTPAAALQPLTTYEVVVTAARDLEGNRLEHELRVGFTTGQPLSGEGSAVLRISNVTTGGAFDHDGYRVVVTVDERRLRTNEMELNTSVVMAGLPAGEVTVHLEDVADNCTVIGGPGRTLALQEGRETSVAFETTCTAPPELASVRLIFSRADNGNWAKLYSMKADGTDLRQLTTGPGSDFNPIVSPDGSRIAYTQTDTRLVHVMDPMGANRQTGGRYYGAYFAWSWSPDGEIIASADEERIHASGTLTTGDKPLWSPDGTTIVFTRVTPDEACSGCWDYGVHPCGGPGVGGNEIWTIRYGSWGTERLLRRMPTHARCLVDGTLVAWTSDGRIVFAESSRLWRMDADGSNVTPLLPARSFHWSDWSPGFLSADDKWMTLTKTSHGWYQRQDVYLLDLVSGALVRVTADGISSHANFLR